MNNQLVETIPIKELLKAWGRWSHYEPNIGYPHVESMYQCASSHKSSENIIDCETAERINNIITVMKRDTINNLAEVAEVIKAHYTDKFNNIDIPKWELCNYRKTEYYNLLWMGQYYILGQLQKEKSYKN